MDQKHILVVDDEESARMLLTEMLTLGGYQAAGRVQGAIATTADDTMAELDPEQGQLGLRGAILKDALAAFRAEGIEIPYPQRDVRIVGSPPPAFLSK